MSLLRIFSASLLTLFLAAAIFLVPTLWGKPWKIEHYYLRVLIDFALKHPMLLSYARVLEPYGIDFHSDDLEDFSVEAALATAADVDRYLAGLREYERDSQSEAQQLSTDILAWFLETMQAGRPFLFHSYPVEQFQGLQSTLPEFMANIHAIEDEEDAEDYIKRLEKFGVAIDQIIAGMRHRESLGIVPPRFVLDHVREEVAQFIGVPASENLLYTDLAHDLHKIEANGSDATLERAEHTIEETVYPAYRRLLEQVEAQLPIATDDDGVWKLPDGDAYYRWALRYHTTSDLSPDEVHQLGLAEVERIRTEMVRILGLSGFPSYDISVGLRKLRADPRFTYPQVDPDAAREAILADYTAIVAEAQGRLSEWFGRLPEAPVVVERVPEFKEAGSAGAYYNPPSFDGTRPGIFYANLRDVSEVQRFAMRTLAYHEAVPGHHLQIAIALENDELPLFRRVIPFTAYIEGWALYAERLAVEERLHPTPVDHLGQLVDEMFRAVRLVVDTGIHAKRWTREQAIAYMQKHTGKPIGEVTAEIERYIVMPGQACAYKVGQLKILELRARAKERLGSGFDLRDFHDVVLENGAMPLTVLERVVDGWIERRAETN